MSAPRPWWYDSASGWIEDANGEPLVSFLGAPEAAELTVRAVNAHKALVELVGAVIALVEAERSFALPTAWARLLDAAHEAVHDAEAQL